MVNSRWPGGRFVGFGSNPERSVASGWEKVDDEGDNPRSPEEYGRSNKVHTHTEDWHLLSCRPEEQCSCRREQTEAGHQEPGAGIHYFLRQTGAESRKVFGVAHPGEPLPPDRDSPAPVKNDCRGVLVVPDSHYIADGLDVPEMRTVLIPVGDIA
ncbi:hypothetical protein HAV15_006244 [Penicillium sp. str. |nr:hypothetical protein HAV15_006244 [Penicillium sp. str. \